MKGKIYFFVAVGLIGIIQAQTSLKTGVSCEEKKIIIDYHNDLRQAVANGTLSGQPMASDMQKMMWDDDLAVIAQNWANNMDFSHNAGRKDPRFSIGENIYKSKSSVGSDQSAEWKKAIDSWHSENSRYQFCEIGGCGNVNVGHYTQVVWSNSIYIGCGFTMYKAADESYHKLYVCDYGPAGNIKTRFPYKTGNGCEKLCCDTPCTVLYGTQCK